MNAKATNKPTANALVAQMGASAAHVSQFIKGISDAIKAEAGMVAACKRAASALAAEQNTAKPLGDEFKRLKAMGRAIIAAKIKGGVKPHILAVLDAALLVLIAPTTEVALGKSDDPKKPATLIQSRDAGTKAEIMEAASTVREVHKVGGGRATRGTKKASNKVADFVKQHKAEIIAMLEADGYLVSRKRAAGKAPAKGKAAPKLGSAAQQSRDLQAAVQSGDAN